MLAETPVTQRSPCYSAVSTSLTNPLPDCSNYSPFSPHPHSPETFLPDREDFKIHFYLAKVPLARGSSALPSPCFYISFDLFWFLSRKTLKDIKHVKFNTLTHLGEDVSCELGVVNKPFLMWHLSPMVVLRRLL